MIALGIDPGFSGALAFYDLATGRVKAFDAPTVTVKTTTGKPRDMMNVPALAALIRDHNPVIAAVELVAARPGQGVVSMFRFGQAYGVVLGVLGALNVSIHHVTPGVWRKFSKLPPGKEASLLRVGEIFPGDISYFTRKKDNGRADAALLAFYAATLIDNPF
jgi:crossover junction endodeoxyribonuclease RuvC